MFNKINSGRIIFMGTSSFSVLSLEKLLNNNYNIIGIVTITDRFSTRNKKFFIESAIKKYSRLHALPILQSDNLNYYHFIKTLQKWNPEIIIIVAFRILPKVIWNIPKLGSFNLHPSLLPNYRGASPIQWVIMNGDIETGLTTFKVNEKIDMGKIFLQKKISINKEENTGSLFIRLSEIGAYLVIDTYKCIIYKCITSKEQNIIFKFKMAPKLFKLLFKINWKFTIKEIYNKIRGLSPFPGAWCILKNNMLKKKEFKIYRACYDIEENLLILELQLEGKLPILGRYIINKLGVIAQ